MNRYEDGPDEERDQAKRQRNEQRRVHFRRDEYFRTRSVPTRVISIIEAGVLQITPELLEHGRLQEGTVEKGSWRA